MAARTDPALRKKLRTAVRNHRDRIRKITDKVLATIGLDNDDESYRLADFVLMAVQGAVINDMAFPEPGVPDKRLNYIEQTVKRLIEPPSQGPS
jgi:hypothetical protein